jgi:MYXO-CTERM domain-containing protein
LNRPGTGEPDPDAGTGIPDGGAAGDGEGGGCGCSSSDPSRRAPGTAVLALVVFALVTRRGRA